MIWIGMGIGAVGAVVLVIGLVALWSWRTAKNSPRDITGEIAEYWKQANTQHREQVEILREIMVTMKQKDA